MTRETSWQRRTQRRARSDGTANYVHVAQVVQVLVGAIIGTISLCDPNVSSAWGVLGWLISILAFVRILSAHRRTTAEDSRRTRIGYRVALSAAAVFCLIAVTTMLAAFNANPQVLGRLEIITMVVLVLLGGTCAVFALRMN